MVPVAASRPKIYNNIATITVIKIKGIKTMNHDIIPKPFSHKAFNKNVINIIIIILKNAVLYNPLIESIIIWVNENITYINAGPHRFIYIC